MPYSDPRIYTEKDGLQDDCPPENSVHSDPLIQCIGSARYVLPGEASPGTHEYYTRRRAASKRRIEEKDFLSSQQKAIRRTVIS